MGFFFVFGYLTIVASLATHTQSAATFDSKLFSVIAREQPNNNVILSPASIQACLALAYLGTEGSTAQELQTALQLSSSNKQEVGAKFAKLFDRTVANSSATFRIANRIYVDQRYQIAPQYNQLANQYFQAPAETVKFAESALTAQRINEWVEQVTANKIRNLLSANSLSPATAAVLVNALYFKAKWVNQFVTQATVKKPFSLGSAGQVQVDMMRQSDQFRYGEFQDLNAKAIEMRYLDTDVSMLVILPNNADGLSALEEKLRDVDFTKLSARMNREEVILQMPKFKIDYDLSLKPVLAQLGITTMFSNNADFSSLLATNEAFTVSEAKHKAFIEVNESGTEAAAATYLKVVPLSGVLNQKIYEFNADHPFVFAIKDAENVYFVGHIANP